MDDTKGPTATAADMINPQADPERTLGSYTVYIYVYLKWRATSRRNRQKSKRKKPTYTPYTLFSSSLAALLAASTT